MADLQMYSNLKEKQFFFSNGSKESFVINTKLELDTWFKDVELTEKKETRIDATALIYRGITEAKFKLFTSAQRIWISDEMNQWTNKNFIQFIGSLVKKANQNPLIKKVFDIYNYNEDDREFPILSLLQHYGAPTPLMDWTYSSNTAFFFATDGLRRKEQPKSDIDNYFAIYRIDKRKYRRELLNIIDFIPDKRYPTIDAFTSLGVNNGSNSNTVFYLSDFERKGASVQGAPSYSQLMIRTSKPITSIYNQNIISQEGLFIFNPSSTKALEEVFNVDLNDDDWNLELNPFDCFNIHKDLAGYLRRKINIKNNIDKKFIYPDLVQVSEKVKEEALNGLI